jgi:hypothetical protein
VGAVILLAVATAVDFVNTAAGGSIGAKALSSLVFALKLIPSAAVGGIAMWLVIRAFRGKFAAPDFRDSVLWSTYMISALVLMLRLVR